MDIESDESERWEDFFGSSTDIAPSIIGYYDNLTNNQEKKEHSQNHERQNVQNNHHHHPQKLSRDCLLSATIKSESNSQESKTIIDNFKLLSPNVHRMLSNTAATGAVNNKLPFHRNHKQTSSLNLKNKTISKQHSLIQIPLSKNTCKLSQSGNELIEYIASSSSESIDLLSDSEKTPTNLLNQHFSYEEESVCVNDESTIEQTRIIDFRKKISHFTDMDKTVEYRPFLRKQNAFVENCDEASHRNTIVEAKSDIIDNLSYSRSKLLASKPLEGSPTLARSDHFTDQSHTSSPSLENSSLSSSKTSLTHSETPTLKSRPLSALSNCSSTSNSSSGSENLAGKLVVSYMASIESLADHSECEHNSSSSNLTMCERAVLEIIDSERSYVEDIGQIIKGYLEDWKERACLKLDELRTLFSNIQEIYEFNLKLLNRLIQSGPDPLKISKCFVDLHEEFNVYTVYCTSYPEAISLLTALLQATHTNSLLISTQKMLNHNLPLGSYLLKPVQRILKYHLLLDNLRKHCDFEEVLDAHKLMKTVAHNIDQVKRKLEQQSRVKELSGILDGWLGPDLTVLGELRQEGILVENNKPRVVFLFQTMLIITKQKEDKRLQFRTYIPCKNLMLVEHLPGDPTSFHVLPFNDPKGQIKLTARNREQKRLWALQIKLAMLEHFDIPNRAKELVFKLGDEDERATDKNTWKWNTSSTPEYLERRSHIRRSEMRTRSKKARKNLSSTLSLDGFSQKDVKMPSFQSYSNTDNVKCVLHGHEVEKCGCDVVKKDLKNALKNRSKSETRIAENLSKELEDKKQHKNSDNDDAETTKFATLRRQKSKEHVDVKSYNSKTIPKRIANIRKGRSKTLKETCKFYTDLIDDDTTVLKITESSDNLHIPDEKDVETAVEYKEDPKIVKKDSEIISELILENKEFTKILNKPPKKKSFDSIKPFSSQMHEEPEIHHHQPEPEEDIVVKSEKLLSRLNEIQNDINSPEPIYESLLRNVHVPYKYAPALTRSVSQQYSKNVELTKPKARPESDYVTLTYSEEGLIKIDNAKMASDIHVSQLRNSDSNINYNTKRSTDDDRNGNNNDTKSDIVVLSNGSPKLLERHGSLSCKPPKNLIQRLISLNMHDSNTTNCDNFSRTFQRRISDVSEMATYKQGSMDLGSRIANLDYADPRTLFKTSTHSINQNLLINKNSIKIKSHLPEPQRDSVFSLTSSSDSVCDPKTQSSNNNNNEDEDSYYEKNVEECLENDFRDSAVYSGDDNDRKMDHEEQLYETIKETQRESFKKAIPPPIPAKPAHLDRKKIVLLPRIMHSNSSPVTTSKGWVLEQVQKFK